MHERYLILRPQCSRMSKYASGNLNERTINFMHIISCFSFSYLKVPTWFQLNMHEFRSHKEKRRNTESNKLVNDEDFIARLRSRPQDILAMSFILCEAILYHYTIITFQSPIFIHFNFETDHLEITWFLELLPQQNATIRRTTRSNTLLQTTQATVKDIDISVFENGPYTSKKSTTLIGTVINANVA